jgi:hypothetical protein
VSLLGCRALITYSCLWGRVAARHPPPHCCIPLPPYNVSPPPDRAISATPPLRQFGCAQALPLQPLSCCSLTTTSGRGMPQASRRRSRQSRPRSSRGCQRARTRIPALRLPAPRPCDSPSSALTSWQSRTRWGKGLMCVLVCAGACIDALLRGACVKPLSQIIDPNANGTTGAFPPLTTHHTHTRALTQTIFDRALSPPFPSLPGSPPTAGGNAGGGGWAAPSRCTQLQRQGGGRDVAGHDCDGVYGVYDYCTVVYYCLRCARILLCAK